MIEGVVVFCKLLDFRFLECELAIEEFGSLLRICRWQIDIEGRNRAFLCFV